MEIENDELPAFEAPVIFVEGDNIAVAERWLHTGPVYKKSAGKEPVDAVADLRVSNEAPDEYPCDER